MPDALRIAGRPVRLDAWTLLEAAPEALLVFDPRRDLILFANAALGRLLDCDPTSLIGERHSSLHPSDAPALIVFAESVLETGSGWTTGLPIQTRTGRSLAVECHASRLHRDSAELIISSLRDIEQFDRRREHAHADAVIRLGLPEWRRAERVFAEIERQNQLLLDAAGEGIYGVNCEGVTTFVNKAAERMLGWTTEELVGKVMHDLVHHSHADGRHFHQHDCPIYAAFRDGVVHRSEDDLFWRKDGTPVPVSYTSTPIRDQGRLVGSVVVFRDITERKQSEQEIRAAFDEVQRLKQRLEQENAYLKEEIRNAHCFEDIVGRSAPIARIVEQIRMVAPTRANVLITGPSGTGKELIARAIHNASDRAGQALVRVNCAAIPRDLFESEFFGHVKGAFTGALKDRVGRFELADGGTLFLDEVGELPLDLQPKLLRVLQEGQFERVGDTRTQHVDVRVIAATNLELEQAVKTGDFRADLYFRLNVFPIQSVPLSERSEDIPLLASHLLDRICGRLGIARPQLSEQHIREMQRYDWPGNVRELENILERAVITSQAGRMRLELPRVADNALPDGGMATAPGAAILTESARRQRDREMIAAALAECGGKVSGPGGAAALLGVPPTTLYSRIRRLGIRTD